MEKLLCPDCGGMMEAGFVPDFSYLQVMQTCWHRGTPEDATFLGMKVAQGGIKHDPKRMIRITTYRCTGCGLLRSYAGSPES